MHKDKVDEHILEFLRNDSRESFVEIGKKLKLSESAIRHRVKNMGEKFLNGLEELKSKHAIIREVRGKGLMIGVELKFEVKDILMEGIKNGLLLLYSGRNILRFLPPLVISEEDITKTLQILDNLLTNEENRRNA